MNCEYCGKNNANVKYTQIINGEKKQMFLCEECSARLGINDIQFSMPMNFPRFLADFFDDMHMINFMPELEENSLLKCTKCGLGWDDFLQTGKFGCDSCYTDFESKINPILRSLQKENPIISREEKLKTTNKPKQNLDDKIALENSNNDLSNKIEKLEKELKRAVKEERYEDAAKLRDEIKKEEE